MISAQINELRELAGDGSMEWVAGPIRASVLREAADTIWQLRDDLQRANDAVQDTEHDESMAWDRVRKAEAEADKLRKLVDGWDFCSKTKSSTFDNCVGCPLFIQTPHNYRCARDERMRELGIEAG